MNTCDTCKWWGDDPYDNGEEVIEWIHSCDNPMNDQARPDTQGSMLSVCGCKFGCIHHESK